MATEQPETCWVCSNIISRYDKVAIVKPVVKERAEIHAHADCCPILYTDEWDLVRDGLDENPYYEPHKKPEPKEILRLKNVDLFVVQEDDHHIDLIVNDEEEVLKDQYPDTSLAIALSRVFDRHGQHVTISMTHSYEEFLKKKGRFNRNSID